MQVSLPSDDVTNGLKGLAVLWIMFRIEVLNARLKPIFEWWDDNAINSARKGKE